MSLGTRALCMRGIQPRIKTITNSHFSAVLQQAGHRLFKILPSRPSPTTMENS